MSSPSPSLSPSPSPWINLSDAVPALFPNISSMVMDPSGSKVSVSTCNFKRTFQLGNCFIDGIDRKECINVSFWKSNVLKTTVYRYYISSHDKRNIVVIS